MEENVLEESEMTSSIDKISTKLKKKVTQSGIIYLSRIPTLMNVNIIRRQFEKFGEVGRIFLQPDMKAGSRGKRGRIFSEGWIEFKNKKVAKQVAASLNNTQVGGKKKTKWREELWNIKYLHRFKWAHLNERLAYEKAVHSQRMRTEISQAKREANFYIQNAEQNERQKKLSKKMKNKVNASTESGTKSIENNQDDKVYEFKLKDTEDEIVKKQKLKRGASGKTDVELSSKKKLKTDEKEKTARKSFLTKIFSGGLDADSDDND